MIDQLERRRLLSFAVSGGGGIGGIGPLLQQLSIVASTDDTAAQNISFSVSGNNLTVLNNGSAFSGPYILGRISSILVSLTGGNDRFNGSDVPIKMTINGGSGNDTLTGGTSLDVINGESGLADVADYSARTGAVSLSLDNVANDGTPGENDNVKADVEILYGGKGNDSLTGSSADNTLRGGGGSDTLIGQGGSDTVDYADKSSTQNVVADLDGLRDDGVAGELDLISADIENLIGGAGNDSLTGNSGPNNFIGNRGGDTIRGGGGVDLVDYSLSDAAVFVTLDGVAGDGKTGENDDIGSDIERVIGSRYSDSIRAGSSGRVSTRVTLMGGRGADTLVGSGASDVLMSGVGGLATGTRDSMSGNGGNDVFINQDKHPAIINGGSGLDFAQEAPEDTFSSIEFLYDRLANQPRGFAPSPTMVETPPTPVATVAAVTTAVSSRILVITGTSTAETISLSQTSSSIFVSVKPSGGSTTTTSFAVSGIDGISIACGSGGDAVNLQDSPSNPVSKTATIKGQGGNDTITGGIGADALLGGPSNDLLNGGNGDDVLNGSDPNSGSGSDGTDTFIGGSGVDELDYSIRSAGLKLSIDGSANDGDPTISENDSIGTDIEFLFGGSGNDTITGNGSDNFLSGGVGKDSIKGDSGLDLINTQCTGDAASALVDSAAGDAGNDIFSSEDGVIDNLSGGDGLDTASRDSTDKVTL